ncbi:MAG: lamin tail domain-containing protein [Anaerolineae bacterium]|nr:lamin tail domain-containing protein [Anaerolineae bacterium]
MTMGDLLRQLGEEQIELPLGRGRRCSWLKLQSVLFFVSCVMCVCCSISSYLWGSASVRLSSPASPSPGGDESGQPARTVGVTVTAGAVAQGTQPPSTSPVPQDTEQPATPTYPFSPLPEPTIPPPTQGPVPSSLPGEIYLVYVEYSRPGRDWTEEHVLIENAGPGDQDMTGWRLGSDYFDAYTFPPGFILAGGASVRVWSGSGEDSAAELHWGRSAPAWDAGGGIVYLWDAQGNVVDSWKW